MLNLEPRYPVNGGPARAINRGLKMALSKYRVILNNDSIMTEGWLDKLIKGLESSDKVGIVSAVTNNISSVCRADNIAREIGVKMPDDPDKYFNALPFRLNIARMNVSYFCVAIKQEVIDKIGYLDERFYAGAEDDDYNDRVRLAGYQTTVCVNCFVYHDHHATIKLIPDIARKRRHNVALLKQKRLQRK